MTEPTTFVGLTVYRHTADAVRAFAEREGVTMATVMRTFLVEGLMAHGALDAAPLSLGRAPNGKPKRNRHAPRDLVAPPAALAAAMQASGPDAEEMRPDESLFAQAGAVAGEANEAGAPAQHEKEES